MRELATLTFVSVDGVMQSPSAAEEDPSDGFALGGWAAPYWDGTMPHVMRTAMAELYDILCGRKTYDIFAGHWPNAPKSEVGDRLNNARKHVVTSSARALHWQNAHGPQQLIQTLHAAGLIDAYRLWVFPVVLGSGKKLFEPRKTPRNLHLQHCEALENGVIHQVYRAG